MPELPEVQTIVNDLNKKILGRTITGVWFDAPKLIKIPKPEIFKKEIKGLKIIKIKRRGKNILIDLLNPKSKILNPKLLLIHQKLTGHLLYGTWNMKQGIWIPTEHGPLEEKVNNYIHLIFYLDNGKMLALSDLRKFAKILFGPKEKIENSPDLKKLGPEPLNPSLKFIKFIKLIRAKQRKIKQVLMDQEVIAGIGNIYSDEILWKAKIHPFKSADKLTLPELKNLYKSMLEILKKAVKLRGTSTSDFRDTSGKMGEYTEKRYAYQRENESCSRCHTKIKRIKLGGRSAHYCPVCQQL